MNTQLTGGRRNWAQLREDFASHTFQWQDLDGLHNARLPEDPPYTSLLHGWSADHRRLVRVRLDSGECAVAALTLDGDSDAAAEEVTVNATTSPGRDGYGSFTTYETVSLKRSGLVFMHPEEA